SLILISRLFFSRSAHPRHLLSLPTRRSSDLKPPFDDARVRQAFNYAVNNDAIVTALLAGAGRSSDAPMAPAVFGYSPQTPYTYRSEEHSSELQSREHLVCRLLLEKKKIKCKS